MRANQRAPSSNTLRNFCTIDTNVPNGLRLLGGVGIREVISRDYPAGGGRGERIGRSWKRCGLRGKGAIFAGTLTGAAKMNPNGIKITGWSQAPGINAASRMSAIQQKTIGLRAPAGISLQVYGRSRSNFVRFHSRIVKFGTIRKEARPCLFGTAARKK